MPPNKERPRPYKSIHPDNSIHISIAGSEIKRRPIEILKAKKNEISKQNEKTAKEIINQLHEGIILSTTTKEPIKGKKGIILAYEIVEFFYKINEIGYDEITFTRYLNADCKEENKKDTRTSNFLGFCLPTQLMIRDKTGQPIPNITLINQLNQKPSST